MKKRKDECQFCSSRSCFDQIFRDEEPKYDEVYCKNHEDEAINAVRSVLPSGKGIIRTHRMSTGKLSRGDR